MSDDRLRADILACGIGFSLNGKHVPIEEFYIVSKKASDKIEDGLKEALEIARAEMPIYTCHKKVRALEIRAIGNYSYEPSPEAQLVRKVVFADPAFPSIMVSEHLFSRYMPMPGDYYVVYEDGYASFSPRKAFLDGYSLAIPENVMMERLNDLATTAAGSVTPEWLMTMEWSLQIARVAREAYITINSLKSQLENHAREKADPDQA